MELHDTIDESQASPRHAKAPPVTQQKPPATQLSNAKTSYQCIERSRLVIELLASAQGMALVAMCLLVSAGHLLHLLTDGLDYRTLLLGSSSDRLVHIVDLAKAGKHRSNARACLVDHLHAALAVFTTDPHRLHRIARALLKTLDYVLNLTRRTLTAMSQLTHLVGDHGKTPSTLTCASRLDGRIQCQQVGLIGNAVYDFQDTTYRDRALIQAIHAPTSMIDTLDQFAKSTTPPFQATPTVFCLLPSFGAVRRYTYGITGNSIKPSCRCPLHAARAAPMRSAAGSPSELP